MTKKTASKTKAPIKPEPKVSLPEPKRIWSEYQKNIFRNIAKEKGHLIIEAYAGSGKSTSAIESFKYVPRGKKILALAFNKIIQKELFEKSPSYVLARTFHAHGFQAIKQRFGDVELDEYKCSNIVKEIIPDEKDYELIDNICNTVAFCKYGLVDSPSQIESIINRFNIDLCEIDIKQFIIYVIKALAKCKEKTNKIDYNDMCWFTFVHNISLGSYDYVYIDEFQDVNKCNLTMAKKSCNPNGGRIIATGDSNQAIYSWLMSDTSVIESLKAEPTTKILQLPISYRCPQKIIDLAQHWVPDIVCPPETKPGIIETISLNVLPEKVVPGSFILSRVNAPLIKICMILIKNNIKANIRGKDIGNGLNFLIKKSKKKNLPSFLTWLETWKNEEVSKLQSKKIPIENTLDRYECLLSLCEESSSIEDLKIKINNMFNDSDEKNIVWLSSIHKSKGLQSPNVFVLRWTFRLWLDESIGLLEKPNEECNLAYISATRSMDKLFIVNKI